MDARTGALGGKMNTDKIKKHLAEYKVNVLGITENGEWWKNHKKYERAQQAKI